MKFAILLVVFIGTWQSLSAAFNFLPSLCSTLEPTSTKAYYISTTLKSWNDAFVACYLQGGQLATPFTPSRDKALRKFMPLNESVWLGARSGAVGNPYRWSTIDEPIRYKVMDTDISYNVSEACLQAGFNEEAFTWKWSGADCLELRKFVCELE